MFKKKSTAPTTTKKKEPSEAENVLQSYKKIDQNVYYKKVKLTDLGDIKREINYEIPLLKKNGIAVVLVDGKTRKEYLAPGIDPYKARKDLNEALEKEEFQKALAEKRAAEKLAAEKEAKSSSNTSKKSSK